MPPVDKDNEQFVIFVRSKMVRQQGQSDAAARSRCCASSRRKGPSLLDPAAPAQPRSASPGCWPAVALLPLSGAIFSSPAQQQGLKRWVPINVITAGTQANLLVKGLEACARGGDTHNLQLFGPATPWVV